jgi:hypothetical protein
MQLLSLTLGDICLEQLMQLMPHILYFWDHELSIIVTSILTVLTVFRRNLDLSSLLIMEIMAIHSWKVTIHEF